MTSYYNRTTFVSWSELSEAQQREVLDGHTSEDAAHEDSYALIDETDETGPIETALPLSMFERSRLNPALGIYGTTAFSGYYLYVGRSGNEGVIAHRHF